MAEVPLRAHDLHFKTIINAIPENSLVYLT